jgi:hypothetical protein
VAGVEAEEASSEATSGATTPMTITKNGEHPLSLGTSYAERR